MSTAAPVQGSVDDWLAWQLTLHASEMELGLTRVAEVAQRLGVPGGHAKRVIVAGTNGKGSCAALIERLLADGARVGTYTSPHLWRYNERFRIDGEAVSDRALLDAFQAVEAARGETSLTFFEYGTLAALWLFDEAAVDYAVLEVGLGGRLDAVNIVDGDIALITNIGLDHVDWLGDDRESIGYEKAGVMRTRRPVICCDRQPPASLSQHAARVGAALECIGHEFDIQADSQGWVFSRGAHTRRLAGMAGVLADNLAGALATVDALTARLPAPAAIETACRAQAGLPGRRERVDDTVSMIYDVGHNAEAVAVLAEELLGAPSAGRTHIVLGMLADKPVETVAAHLEKVADRFYFAGLDSLGSRGLAADDLARRVGIEGDRFDSPAAAVAAARNASEAGDRIVVCGSFLTVAHARRPMPS
ncbi:FolC bifunctional protein [Salinisphaera sp. T5B8]|uniref:bifunctional tetrahydrofolate synthase/dihydrofolate synthase n=1 Tax=Salinisphaera sp. T5B8 TaxID=1304154 RepID=UPI003341ED3B